MVELDHVSHSQITMWLRCPRSWEFRYVKGLKTPPSGALILGHSYHKALEVNYSQKVETGEDLSLTHVLDAFSDAWSDRMVKESEILWEGRRPGAMKDQGIDIVNRYHTEVAPTIQPVVVEGWYEKIISGTKFVGSVDLVDDQDERIDHKTAAQAYNQGDVDKDLQASAHAFALARPGVHAFHVAVKTKIPRIQIIKTTRTTDDILWWLDLARAVITSMKTGIAPPNPIGWHCSPRFCGYYSMCRPTV